MFLLKKILSAWFLPPLGLLVFALIALGLGRGRPRLTIAAAIAVALTLVMSLPMVADLLVRPLEPAPISAAALNRAQAIVILGCGIYRGSPEYGGDTVSKYSLERLRYGARLARVSNLPVLVSGGSVYGGREEAGLMKQVLENEFSVPVRWVEDRSRDTAENGAYASAILKTADIRRIALVTHAWHMPRAVSSFNKYGLEVIPAPTVFTPRGMPLFERLLPSAWAFERSAAAIHEWVGRLLLY